MAREPHTDRLYTEKETARILRRAADIQVRTGRSRSEREGVSGDELMRIGQEVGLEAESLREAMRGLDDDADEAQTRWLGAPPSYEFERVLEGPFDEDQWQAVVGELNASFHQSIAGVTSGPVRTWHWKHDLGSIHFTATQTPNSVRLKMVSFIDDAIALGMVLTTIGLFGGVMASWAIDAFRPLISLLLSIGLVLVLAGGFRRTTSKWFRRDRRKLTRLMDRVEDAIRSQRVEPQSTTVEAPGDVPLENRLKA